MGKLSHTTSSGRPASDGGLLTVAQAAKRLDRSVMTVHRWISKGVLPVAMRLPGDTGAYLVYAADVERLAAEAAA